MATEAQVAIRNEYGITGAPDGETQFTKLGAEPNPTVEGSAPRNEGVPGPSPGVGFIAMPGQGPHLRAFPVLLKPFRGRRDLQLRDQPRRRQAHGPPKRPAC